MNHLPNGWRVVTLNDLTGPEGMMTDGDWIESKDQDPNGSVRLIQLADIGDRIFLDRSKRFLTNRKADELGCIYLSPGDLLIARMPDPLGRACIFPALNQASITAVDVCIWRTSNHHTDTQWLMYAVNSPPMRDHIATLASGTTRQRVSGGNLKRLEIPTPPYREQRRIASKLDSLLSLSKNTQKDLERIPHLIERYKQAILTQAFCGKLTTDWRNSSADVLPPWQELSLGEIANVGTGATPKRGDSRFYRNGTIPWVTSAVVNNSHVDGAEEMITEAALKETNCKVFPAGTLLMAMYGEGQTRGRVAVLDIAAATNQALAAISIRDSEKILSDFVLWFLRANYLELRQQAAGGVQPNLNLGIVKAIRIPIPPITEQREIVRQIDRLFAHIDLLSLETTRATALLSRLDQATLAKAFRGELVPQKSSALPEETNSPMHCPVSSL